LTAAAHASCLKEGKRNQTGNGSRRTGYDSGVPGKISILFLFPKKTFLPQMKSIPGGETKLRTQEGNILYFLTSVNKKTLSKRVAKFF
jgi:hypothetical protein